MKNIKTTLDYISLAVSKDSARYNMSAPWVQYGKLIATDGHRLHWHNCLANDEQAKGLTGESLEHQPDVRAVIPDLSKYQSAIIGVKHDAIKQVEALAKYITTLDKHCAVDLAVTDSGYLRLNYGQGALAAGYLVTEIAVSGNLGEVRLNLNYLLDALTLVERRYSECTVYTETDTSPIQITRLIDGKECNALIMPIKK